MNSISNGEKISNGNEASPLLQDEKTTKNLSQIQEMAIPNAETPPVQEVKIAENPPIQKPEITASVTSVGNSNAISGPFLNNIPKEIPGRDSMFSGIKKSLWITEQI